MTDDTSPDERARAFFDDLWRRGDFWDLERSEFERAKYLRQLAILGERPCPRVLEVGCGAGAFTRLLAQIAGRVVALDVSPTAIERAQAAGAQSGTVEYRVANVMDYDPHADGPWDLVVMSETIYYLGWLYPFFDVGWLAFQLFEATREGGRLLMANTCGGVEDYLLRPWLIRTYRDLFLNVGYGLEAEEALRGTKDDVPLEVLISVFVKHPEQAVGGS
jgi:SAM-dependent methyltransferase